MAFPRRPSGTLPTHMGASVRFSSTVVVREQVELLEHHADLRADGVDGLHVVGELDAVDDEAGPWCSSSRLMQRMSVDLPEPDGPQMTMRSPVAT